MDKTIEQKIDLTVDWLREMVKSSGAKGLLVGLSGGIDSTVVAGLIKRAFPNDSLGVILPCKSSGKDREDAILCAEACGIDTVEVELSEAHETILKNVMEKLRGVKAFDENRIRLTDANLRARLRMSTLYAIAGAMSYMVVGTDNAAETHTGYFTKYGDGGVDLLPISRLPKRDVYKWGEVLGAPESVLKRAPSAGLWEGQTDEGEMGTTYDMIDDYLEGKTIPEKDRKIIEAMHKRTEHKREMPPQAPEF